MKHDLRYQSAAWQRAYRAPLSQEEQQELRVKAASMGYVSIEDTRLTQLERSALEHILGRLAKIKK